MSSSAKQPHRNGGTTEFPIVSIIVVCYNHESFIDDCLRSCVAQVEEFARLEIVVTDDGSRDATPTILRRWAAEYPTIVRLVLCEKNTGIASNLNRGLGAASGSLIAWLGGDDIMLPGKIRRQTEFLATRTEAAGCYHDAEVFAWPSGLTLGLFSKLYAGKAAKVPAIDIRHMLDPRFQMLPSTVMVRRDRMPAAFDERLRFHNDYLFDLETIARGGPYVRMEGVFTRYRKHDKSIGLDPSIREIMLEENLIVMAIAEARYPSHSARINRRAIYYLSLEAIRSFRDGKGKRARAICRAIFARHAWMRAGCLVLFGGQLARLADSHYRSWAVKLRSLLG